MTRHDQEDDMPDSESVTHAAQASDQLRRLAQATRTIPDPGEIYDLLGDLSRAITSLAQSLHQIAKVHDNLEPGRARVAESARSGRATSYAISWEVHRAAEMLTQVAGVVDRAHQDEAKIAYVQPDPLLPPDRQATPAAANNGLHL
jgi:ABC-type transporter Mla subunit MlaD